MKILYVMCYFALTLSSCAYKEHKRLKNQHGHSETQCPLSNMVARPEINCDFRLLPLADLKKIPDADWLKSVTAIREVINLLQSSSQKCDTVDLHALDSINILKSKFRSFFTASGNVAKKEDYNNKTYDCYIVNVKKSNIRFYWKNKNNHAIKSLKTLLEITKSNNNMLIFATNAGMYTPEYAPKGLFIQDGRVLRSIDRKNEGYGNFYMQPNGIFFIDTSDSACIITTDQYKDSLAMAIEFATQSGPMVVTDGKVNPIFKQNSKHLNIRSGVGIIDDSRVVFVISNQRVSFYDFAHVFKSKFNCSNALYLDGAISEMYLPELFRFDGGGHFGPIIGITKD